MQDVKSDKWYPGVKKFWKLVKNFAYEILAKAAEIIMAEIVVNGRDDICDRWSVCMTNDLRVKCFWKFPNNFCYFCIFCQFYWISSQIRWLNIQIPKDPETPDAMKILCFDFVPTPKQDCK